MPLDLERLKEIEKESMGVPWEELTFDLDIELHDFLPAIVEEIERLRAAALAGSQLREAVGTTISEDDRDAAIAAYDQAIKT